MDTVLKKIKLGVLGSTKGTDLQAIIDSIDQNKPITDRSYVSFKVVLEKPESIEKENIVATSSKT